MKGHRWFAAIYDAINRGIERQVFGPLRRTVVGEAEGLALELGAGTGASFPYYRAADTVIATEPDPFMLRRARRRAAEVDRRVVLVQCVAEALPFRGAAFDAVVATIVLCTVDDLARSLVEARRVLRPGGRLRFLEHVRPHGTFGRVVDAATPVWRRLCAGCHPNRRTATSITAAGFHIEHVERQSLPGGVPLISGVAARS